MDARTITVAMAATLLVASGARGDVFNMGDPNLKNLEFVTVGDPGNAPDKTYAWPGYGSVSYTYRIGKYDVTVAQYCQFLNAVATQSDPFGLYNNIAMPGGPGSAHSGINRTGSSGNWSYNTTSGYAVNNGNFPMNCITWANAARFCNWLTNGQPTGPEGAGTTETGSYTLNGSVDDANLQRVTRNANPKYVIPTEDEWYKAAYYKGGSTNAGYWFYPTESNTAPSSVLSSTGTNNANYNTGTYRSGCTDPINYLTEVGSFAGSPGPYGTYDMGGDVNEWNEATHWLYPYRGLRGGGWGPYNEDFLNASQRRWLYPSHDFADIGFRVVEVPEPAAMAVLALGGLAVLRRRRRSLVGRATLLAGRVARGMV